jgi:hypothetical protein
VAGRKSYNVSWVLLTFLGMFGIHRFYLGKWLTELLWLLTGGADAWRAVRLLDAERGGGRGQRRGKLIRSHARRRHWASDRSVGYSAH